MKHGDPPVSVMPIRQAFLQYLLLLALPLHSPGRPRLETASVSRDEGQNAPEPPSSEPAQAVSGSWQRSAEQRETLFVGLGLLAG